MKAVLFLLLILLSASLAGNYYFISKHKITKPLLTPIQDVSNIDKIEGQFGKIEIEKNKDLSSKTVFVNNVSKLTNDHANFEKVYPSLQKPEIIIVTTDCGGSACGIGTPFLIDVTTKPVFLSEALNFRPTTIKLSFSNDNIVLSGISSADTNELGDPLPITLIYNREKKTLHYNNISNSEMHYEKFAGLHPWDLLGDPNARSIFLTQMSPEQFKQFREYSAVSGAMKLIEYRYLYGEGMLPHSGADQTAAFVIDILKNEFLAIEKDESNKTTFTNASKDNIGVMEYLINQNSTFK